jgi:hypothetical protein
LPNWIEGQLRCADAEISGERTELPLRGVAAAFTHSRRSLNPPAFDHAIDEG